MSSSSSPTFGQSLIVRACVRSFSSCFHHPPLQAGGIAGTSVDLLFYPIDSIKTRLQSHDGFYKAGGFRGIYNGVGSVIVGSAPGGML
jgi:solute carrier family 25 (mitochondrial S-adenosylmethionine transporter), member 26